MDTFTRLCVLLIVLLSGLLISIIVMNPAINWLPLIVVVVATCGICCLVATLTFIWIYGPLLAFVQATEDTEER